MTFERFQETLVWNKSLLSEHAKDADPIYKLVGVVGYRYTTAFQAVRDGSLEDKAKREVTVNLLKSIFDELEEAMNTLPEGSLDLIKEEVKA